MKSTILTITLLSLVCGIFAATQRTPDQAAAAAAAFLQQQAQNSRRQAPAKDDLRLVATHNKTASPETAFYVFDIAGNGFILVSGDTRATDILGYSDTGNFNEADMPDNMRLWLQHYTEQLSRMDGRDADTFQRAAAPTEVIEPLLEREHIRWNQTKPFNDSCPLLNGTRCVTGCVPVAFAQVMRYYKHPNQGSGSFSYEWNGQTLSADFNRTYRWEDMPGIYSGYSAVEAQTAAELLRDLGIAVETKYGTGGSSANEQRGGVALMRYFGYDAGMTVQKPAIIGYDAFTECVLRELRAERPVILSASTESGKGHSFIADGVDAEGRFHINWGWGGYCDGYFVLTVLTPDGQGTGGGQVGEGYTVNLRALTGIQPDKGNSALAQLATEEWTLLNKARIGRNDGVACSFALLQNYGMCDWTGHIGLAICNTQGERLMNLYSTPNTLSLEMFHRFPVLNIPSAAMPATLENGDYLLVPVYSPVPDGGWETIQTEQGHASYYAFTITSDSVFFTIPEKPASPYMRDLEATDMGNDTVRFSWQAETPAPCYAVEVYYNGNRISSDTVSATEAFVPFYLFDAREYNWRLYALDEEKHKLEEEKGSTFTAVVHTNFTPANLSCEQTDNGLTFTWEGAAPVFQLEVQYNGSLIYRGMTTGHSYTLPTANNGVYNWSVYAVNTLRNIYISPAATATYTIQAELTGYLYNLQVTENGDETATFTWQEGKQASSYVVEVLSGSSPILLDTVSTTQTTARFYFTGRYGYTWSVTALDDNLQVLEKANGGTFAVTVTTDYTPFNLRGETTANGQLFSWDSDAPAFIITIGWNGNWYIQDMITDKAYLCEYTWRQTYNYVVQAVFISPAGNNVFFPISDPVQAEYTPADPLPTDMSGQTPEPNHTDGKYLKDGQLLIFRNGKTYNTQGLIIH